MAAEVSSWLTIRSSSLSAQINPFGAELSALLDGAGRALLWDGDPSVWKGRAPLLFPIVGALADGKYRLGDARYSLSRHGFARDRRFEVLAASDDEALLQLSADADSLAIYPFRFELEMHYALAGATLIVTASIRNRDSRRMTASFGYHPAFRWPLPYHQPREAHCIEFGTDEPAPVRRLDSTGLLAPESHPTPVAGRRLMLADSLFAPDVVIFDQLRSRSLTYGAAQGPRLRISFPDAPLLGIWTKVGAGFVCIEPWHGSADPAGFAGDFTAKPGVFSLESGAGLSTVMRIELLS